MTKGKFVPVFWVPVGLLPAQEAGRRRGAVPAEIRLVAAILEDALQSVARGPTSRGRRREFEAALKWFNDDSREWPFAFSNVCDFLALDPIAVRQRLQRLLAVGRGAHPARPPRRDRSPLVDVQSAKEQAA